MIPEGAFKRALDEIEVYGWERFTPASVGLSNLTKEGFLRAFIQHIDQQLAQEIGEVDQTLPFEERFMEVILIRFDLLTPYKKGLDRLTQSLYKTPLSTLETLPFWCASMEVMLDLAGYQGQPCLRQATLLIYTTFYAYIFRTWLADDAPDAGKTLAVLHRGLSEIGSFLGKGARFF